MSFILVAEPERLLERETVNERILPRAYYNTCVKTHLAMIAKEVSGLHMSKYCITRRLDTLRASGMGVQKFT